MVSPVGLTGAGTLRGEVNHMTDRSCADVTERLFHMFEAVHPLPVITAVVRQCRTDLDGVPSGAIPELLERLASQRLSDLQPAP